MIRRSIVLLLAAAALAKGQGSDGVKVRFLAERAPKELGQVLLAEGETRGPAFELPHNHLSEPIDAPARRFELRAVKPDVSLSTITLPESGKSFIALMIPAPKGGYVPVVLRADDPGFRPGDVYFYNHAGKTVLGYVGTAKFILAPAKGQVLRPAGAKAENYYDVGFGVREKEGDRALSTTRWPVDNRSRSYVFFFDNPVTKRVDFRAVDEFVPPATP